MKKIIIIVILAGMLGFTVYKFVADSKEPTLEEQADSISDNTIVSPPKEGGEEEAKSDGEGLRSEEHTSELQSRGHLVCRLLAPCYTLFPYTTLFRSVIINEKNHYYCNLGRYAGIYSI